MDEMAFIGKYHSNFPLGFSDPLMTWGTSPVWQDVVQHEVRLVWDPVT